MAVTMLNDTDLRLLCGMSDIELRRLISTKTIREALIFRRNLQISLADYSKKHPAIGRIDRIQGNALLICKRIEDEARNAYTLTGWRRLKASNPNMTLTQRIERKEKLKKSWESLLKTYSY